jgi:hypothetical protein
MTCRWIGRCWLLTICVLSAILCDSVTGAAYPDRLVWVFGWRLRNDSDAAEITSLLEKARQSGFNGAVLSASLDTLCRQSPDYFRRLGELRRTCERLDLELIPSVFSVGYGGGALAHNRHLAEGLPVLNAPFLVEGGEARLVADSAIQIANGGFEEFEGHKFRAFNFHDAPGVTSFPDTNVFRGGKASLRIENFRANQHGHGRIMQRVSVEPHRCYRVSVWVKTEEFGPVNAFRLLALAGDRDIAPRTFRLDPTADWRKLTMLVNSLEFDTINLYAGVWGGRAGKVWLDDWSIEEAGPLNALRRAGTPVTVRNADGTIVYDEGRDYTPLEDPGFDFQRVDRPAPPLRLSNGSRIQDGQRLQVSWFHPMVIHESQVTVCMAEPELYEIYDHEAKLLLQHLQPRRVLLNMDEVRMGGTCSSCSGRNMAELLGECITKQTQILRRHSPEAEVYIWSDMLDPNHNARPNYYLVRGDYTGSWIHVPKDLIMAVWGGAPREESLRFFAGQNFRVLAACYYDADNLDDAGRWLHLTGRMPNVRGYMYTTWERKYELLPAFGALLQNE